MDRSKDPSPFAWILGGALVLVGLAAAASAIRKGDQAQLDDVWARPTPRPAPAADNANDSADADEMLDGHPS